METKVIEIGGQYVVKRREGGEWKDEGSFGSVREAQVKEAELAMSEGDIVAQGSVGQRVTRDDSEKPSKKELREQAEASVDAAAAETAQDQAEHRRETLDQTQDVRVVDDQSKGKRQAKR